MYWSWLLVAFAQFEGRVNPLCSIAYRKSFWMRSPMGPMRMISSHSPEIRRKTYVYMISSLRTSRSPAMNIKGGRPPRYESAGLTRGCCNKPLGAYNWTCCVTSIILPVDVCNEMVWSASRSPGRGSDAVDPTLMGPSSVGSIFGIVLPGSIGRAAWGIRLDPLFERR